MKNLRLTWTMDLDGWSTMHFPRYNCRKSLYALVLVVLLSGLACNSSQRTCAQKENMTEEQSLEETAQIDRTQHPDGMAPVETKDTPMKKTGVKSFFDSIARAMAEGSVRSSIFGKKK